MSQPEEAAPPQRPWAILVSAPVIIDAEDITLCKDLAVDVNKPPVITVLKVARGFIPDIKYTDPRSYPYIAATDPSGRLLLCTNHLTTVDDIKLQHILDEDNTLSTYFLGDVTNLTVFQLPNRVEPKPDDTNFLFFQLPDRLEPDPDGPSVYYGNVGLIRRDDSKFMVAELQPKSGTDEAILLCHWVGTVGWFAKKLQYSPEHPIWRNNGVISNAGKLWWVDLSYGLLTCDPFVEQPDLRYIPLPEGRVSVVPVADGKERRDALWKLCERRCVKVSDGKLRYVEIDVRSRGRMASKLCMWTLDDPEGSEWTPRHVVPFSKIWDDKSYMATKLRRKVPVLALVHPWNPDVVYFSLGRSIFSVDLAERKVLSCENFDRGAAGLPLSSEVPTALLFHAWELPDEFSFGAGA